jgi:ketosteroid isomerase-like protein
MSKGSVEHVRFPLTVRASSRRRIEERVALRFPPALAFLTRLVFRLPLHSRVRRALIHRAYQLGWEAQNREDYEAGFAFYDPDVEMVAPSVLATIGVEFEPRGLDGRVRSQRKWNTEWGGFRFEPQEAIDLGDGRLLTIGHIAGSGLSSGAVVGSDWAVMHTVSGGRVVREEVFLDRSEALEAAGLSE